MRSRLPVPLGAALALVLAACPREDTARAPDIPSTSASPSASPPNVDTAVSLVNRFIAAESVGNWWPADSLVAWRYCDWDHGTDFFLVTTAIHVRPTQPVGDSALVQVIYDLAGRVWLGDPPSVGPQRTRFAARGSSDTVIYRVFADSTGRLWMGCGDFHQNHLAVSQVHDFVIRFDDSARAAWKSVFPKTPR
jgi:hypothetical protein